MAIFCLSGLKGKFVMNADMRFPFLFLVRLNVICSSGLKGYLYAKKTAKDLFLARMNNILFIQTIRVSLS